MRIITDVLVDSKCNAKFWGLWCEDLQNHFCFDCLDFSDAENNIVETGKRKTSTSIISNPTKKVGSVPASSRNAYNNNNN